MSPFQIYCRWNEKIYAYNSIANAILRLDCGVWLVQAALGEELYGKPFDGMSVCEGSLYLHGHGERHIVRYHLESGTTESIVLPADWADEAGVFFSYLCLWQGGILLFPFRGNQVRILDQRGNELSEPWQADLAESLDRLRRDNGMAQIRGFGAHAVGDRLYMVMAGAEGDRLVLYDTRSRKTEAIRIGTYGRLQYLNPCSDRFYVQGIQENCFCVAELTLDGEMLREVRIGQKRRRLPVQWVDSGNCLIADRDRLFAVDECFHVREFPLLTGEGEKLDDIDDGLFIDSKGRIYDFHAETGQFCCLRENGDGCRIRLYRAREKQCKGVVCQERNRAELGIFQEILRERFSADSEETKIRNSVGESIWNALR